MELTNWEHVKINAKQNKMRKSNQLFVNITKRYPAFMKSTFLRISGAFLANRERLKLSGAKMCATQVFGG